MSDRRAVASPPRPAGDGPDAGARTGLRLDVEGLRGVAVLVVLLYHLGVPFVDGGFVGVDVFFVISGFLITGLLLREVERTGRVSLLGFYARRARRLLPAASIVLLATAVGGWWLLPGSAHMNLGRDVVASTLYLVNWELADRAVDYLAEGDLPSALQHYWSLSVEEQFYVVWPLLMILVLVLARRAGLRARPLLLAAVLALGVASFTWSVLLTADDPARAYFVSTTRVWELAVGAVLAFAVHRLPSLTRRAAVLLAWAGSAAVLAAVLLLSPSTPWPGSAAALPTLGAAALLAAGTTGHATAPGRILSSRPLVLLGGLSYAVYLWHWPVIVVVEARYGDLGLLDGLAVVVVVLGLAWATGRFVEAPIRFDPRLRLGPGRTMLVAAAAMAVTVAAGAAVVATVPTLPRSAPDGVAGARAMAVDPGAPRWTLRDDLESVFDEEGPLYPPPALAVKDAPRFRGCQVGPGVTEPRSCVRGAKGSDDVVALLGDSKMGQWLPAVSRVATQEGWRLEGYMKAACTFSRSGVADDCAAHTDAVLDRFAEDGAPDRVLISQRNANGYDDSEGGFSSAVAELVDLGVEVAVLADNATPGTDALFTCVELHPDDYGACSFDRDRGLAESGNQVLAAAADDLDLAWVDVNEWICPSTLERCPPAIGGALVYRQGSHVTATYVRTMTPVLRTALADIGWADGPGGLGPGPDRAAPPA